jgi:hypothetical protein
VGWWSVHEERWRGHFREHDSERREIETARAVIDRRLDEMNALRHQIDVERSAYLTRDAAAQDTAAIVARVEVLEQWKANLTGKFAVVVAANAVFITGVVFLANYVTK